MDKKAIARALRDQGFTYQQIADHIGVSRQRVAQICGRQSDPQFRVISESCIYKNIRWWMNLHKVSRNEFVRRMGLTADAENSLRLSRVLRGEDMPRKDYIDRMMDVTGMTYEVMFATE